MAKEPVSMAVDNDFQILSLVAQGPEVGTTAAEGGSLYYTSLVTLKSIKECACEQYQ
ncbi:MAG: hypothetical protein GY861_05895 [bacterium]|nr:hypothetical protein [bacterium]